MPLDRKTVARRIASARVLRGMDREELGALMEAEGFGKHDIRRLEQMDPKLPLTRPRRETLARLLSVPESWFTAADDELFEGVSQPQRDWLEETARQLLEIVREEAQPPTTPPRDVPTGARPDDPPFVPPLPAEQQ